ncbi:zinc finger, CCHC-type, retrotransposon gag domain protein [Tanacetum coccineum]
MSNTNTNLQTQTLNALHNAIMEAGVSEGSSDTRTEGYMETYKNVSQDIRDQLNAEAEAIHETVSDHTQVVETEQESINDAVQHQLKKLVSGEVSQTLEALFSTLLGKVTKTINQVVNNEFNKRKDGTLIKNRAENEIKVNQNLDNNFGYKNFGACKPPEFQGEQEPIISYRWLVDIKEAFSVSRCPTELQVRFVTHLLRERVKDWWDLTKRTMGTELINRMEWREFKDMFLKVFAPEAKVKKIQREFLVMCQTTETVSEFTGLFMDRA